MTPETVELLKAIFNLADTITTIALLLAMLVMFFRGDILSRPVYEKLTEEIVGEMVNKVTKAICEKLDEKL